MATIKTPDQRVRVFISSTINELADERIAARKAVENLRLIPVFFEAGARPHPPRDLYSSYLDQSHIFLGIYWNSYGWIAPGAAISGLEDEYRLCDKRKPKLIYIKDSNERQPQLQKLIQDIENSDTACYQKFKDAEELKRLIENDLSVLMSEIFENSLYSENDKIEEVEISQNRRIDELPLLQQDIIGREEEFIKLEELIGRKDTNEITLLGAGGTGKTTLAIHFAHRVKENFKHGAAFVPLAPVTDYKLVPGTIASILDIQDSGKQPIEQTILEFLIEKELLLILDNFEQVIEASKFISDILSHCKYIKILVTSRTSLHIRYERIFSLLPLSLPDDNQILTANELNNYSSTKLFVDRAQEVNHRLELNQENTDAILEICRKMDGLPLAIELAAARTKFFQPAALLLRIDKALDFVSKGHRDLPERQKTLRAAIEWSYNLLSEEVKKAFRQLGIFKRSWTMDSADLVLSKDEINIDIEELSERLLDVSLIKPMLVNHSAEPRFNMLQTVHEFANEILEKSPEFLKTKENYATYFYNLCVEAYDHLWTRNSQPWLDKIEFDYQNIRAAFHILIEIKEYDKAWHFIYLLSPYWTVRGGFSECRDWIETCGMHDESISNQLKDPVIKGRSLAWAGYCQLFLFDFNHGFGDLVLSESILETAGDKVGLCYAYMFDGCYGSYLMRPDSEEKILKGKALCDELKDHIALGMYYLWSTEYFRQKGQIDMVYANVQSAIEIAKQYGILYIQGAAYIIKFSFDCLNPNNDWTKTAAESIEMYQLFPLKGYKGLKGGAKSGLAYSYIKLGRLEEAEKPMMQALEYARTSGELESNVYGVMEASTFYSLKGNAELAYTLFGALDHFIETTGYPLVGGAEVQYTMTNSLLKNGLELPMNKNWYQQGRQLTLPQAILCALNQ